MVFGQWWLAVHSTMGVPPYTQRLLDKERKRQEQIDEAAREAARVAEAARRRYDDDKKVLEKKGVNLKERKV